MKATVTHKCESYIHLAAAIRTMKVKQRFYGLALNRVQQIYKKNSELSRGYTFTEGNLKLGFWMKNEKSTLNLKKVKTKLPKLRNIEKL